jgi:hypothetical protein
MLVSDFLGAESGKHVFHKMVTIKTDEQVNKRRVDLL